MATYYITQVIAEVDFEADSAVRVTEAVAEVDYDTQHTNQRLYGPAASQVGG